MNAQNNRIPVNAPAVEQPQPAAEEAVPANMPFPQPPNMGLRPMPGFGAPGGLERVNAMRPLSEYEIKNMRKAAAEANGVEARLRRIREFEEREAQRAANIPVLAQPAIAQPGVNIPVVAQRPAGQARNRRAASRKRRDASRKRRNTRRGRRSAYSRK